jgi:hypothetical protein
MLEESHLSHCRFMLYRGPFSPEIAQCGSLGKFSVSPPDLDRVERPTRNN